MDINNNNKSRDISPLQDKVNLNLFFSGGHRRKFLEDIKSAISGGVEVITITGDEGVGKTMICRMLEKEIPADVTAIYLPDTLESFDDVVRVIALKLGTESSDKSESTGALVSEIILNLQENDKYLVLIFDQAERMYLATIERIRKMLDQVNSVEKRLQLIFSGRNSLLENLHQLKICDFSTIEEKDFSLNYLGLSETYAYLNHCAQQIAPVRGKSVFTPEVAKKIFSLAQGNLRMTSMLASKTLEAFEANGTVDVILDRVKDQADLQAKVKRKTKKIREGVLRARLIYGGLGLISVLLLLLLFIGDEKAPEKITEVPPIVEEQVVETPPQEPAETATVETPPSAEVAATDTIDEVKVESSTEEASEIVVDQQRDSPAERLTGQEQEIEEVLQPQVSEETVTEPEQTAVVEEQSEDIPAVSQTVPSILAEKKKKIFDLPPPVEMSGSSVDEEQQSGEKPEQEQTADALDIPANSQLPEQGESVADTSVAPIEDSTQSAQIAFSPLSVEEKKMELVPEPEVQTSAVSSVEQEAAQLPSSVLPDTSGEVEKVDAQQEEDIAAEEVIILAELTKRIPPGMSEENTPKKIVKIAPVKLKETEVQEGEESTALQKQIMDLYQKRLAAGSGWYGIKDNNVHTVQLMVLTADQAEANLKRRFADQAYRDIADDLYIIKDKGSKVFVYYGQYSDLDAARQARNTMPIFLRKHNPYAISVKEAISKAGSQE